MCSLCMLVLLLECVSTIVAFFSEVSSSAIWQGSVLATFALNSVLQVGNCAYALHLMLRIYYNSVVCCAHGK
jgi:hypothetical protein